MSGNDWYSEDCETFADYKFKQEQAHEKREQVIEDLLSGLRVKRKAFEERTITFDAWFHERRMIMREAEFHGVTDDVLKRGNES